MLQVIQNYNTGKLTVEEVPPPSLQSGGILVRTMASLISAGTERHTIETARKSLVGKARSRPDMVRKVIQIARRDGWLNTYRLVKNKLDTPVPLGYSNAGIVIAVAEDVDEFSVGDRVACAGQGYASHAETVFVPKNLAVRIPDYVSFEEAAYTTLGAIALQGVRQADPKIGETVVVIGLGLLGNLTVQLLKANGCRVMGIDLQKSACSLALQAGADYALLPDEDAVPFIHRTTNGIGADSVIITAATHNNAPVILAGDLLRHKGTLIIEGAVPADIPRSPFYEKEIDVRFARSYGPGRYDPLYEEIGIDYPYAYVRWTENRNMQAFTDFLARRLVKTEPITTHRFKIEDAEKAYALITGKSENKETVVGVILTYDHRYDELPKKPEECPPTLVHSGSTDTIRIGFLGAGNFAQNMLLPHFKKISGVELTAVSTSKGITAKKVADKFKFRTHTTNNSEILQNADIQAVFITTRHHLHAPFVIEALQAGKAVYVEKPLALSPEELDQIITVYRQNPRLLMVGYNRRFAPVVSKVKQFLSTKISPYVMHYRINAGHIPKDHWIQDPMQGGGRIIGEVCHFVDLMIYFLKATPTLAYARTLSYNAEDITQRDNVIITLNFSDGSIGSISYIAIGDTTFPKERIELFGEQSVAVIDDFKKCTLTRNGRTQTFGGSKQDKGYRLSVEAFIHALKNQQESPITFSDLIATSRTIFAILESLSTGQPVTIR